MVPDVSAGSLLKVASMLLVSWLSHNDGEFEGSFFLVFFSGDNVPGEEAEGSDTTDRWSKQKHLANVKRRRHWPSVWISDGHGGVTTKRWSAVCRASSERQKIWSELGSKGGSSWGRKISQHCHIRSKINSLMANYKSLNFCGSHMPRQGQSQRANSVKRCRKNTTLSLFLQYMCELRASVCKSIYVPAFTWLRPKEWDCQYKQNKVTPLHKVSRSSKEERLGRSLSASLWRLFRNITLETDLGVGPGEEITVHVSSNLCVSWETLERGDIWKTLFTVILYFSQASLQLRSVDL